MDENKIERDFNSIKVQLEPWCPPQSSISFTKDFNSIKVQLEPVNP